MTDPGASVDRALNQLFGPMTDPAVDAKSGFYCAQCGVPLSEEGAFCPKHVDTKGVYPPNRTEPMKRLDYIEDWRDG